MDRETINFYLDVVQELVDRAVPVTVDNINRHLAPANNEAEIIEALTSLVGEHRLEKTTIFAWGDRESPTESEQYHIVKRK
ncbi:MAG TPA: hypothetical protein VM282_14635 [Acidimicrobiales bacterium]|nr:hypothetical protein [Acidimicrobiales bacterium]